MPVPQPSPAPPENQVPPAATPTTPGMMTLAVAVVVVAALYVGREVLIPIALAVLLSFVLAPLVNLLRRLRLGRVPSVIIAVVLALSVALLLGGIIGTQVAQLAEDLPRFQTTISDKIGTVQKLTVGRASSLLSRLNREVKQAGDKPANPAAPGPSDAASPADSGTEGYLPVEVHQPAPTPVQVAESILGPILAPLATAGIVFVVAVFILMQQEDLRDRLIRLFGSSDLHRTTVALDDAARRLSRYFLTQLALNATFGVIIGAGLWFIGVPSPVLWGVAAALLRFVPYIGAFLAGALPVALAAAVDPGWSMMLWTAALFLVTEPIMGQVVEPLAYGHSTGLSPVSIVVSAIFWTWIWGPIGLILSTPLTLCLVVLGRHVERLEFLDVLFGDRPALTPAESFYQRMLAGDPDEALDQAEALLKEHSLSSYYDEVALKGLQLAANDASRDTLSPLQIERINEAIEGLVQDLADRDDVAPRAGKPPREQAGLAATEKPAIEAEPVPAGTAAETADLPPAWRGEAPVMCIAGRGPLDEAAARMLAQLLSKHGLGARVVPHEKVSRSNIIGLDVTGVAMVCVSYLDITGSPAHLRYLLRRLKQRLPDAPILVGLWPAEDAILTDERLRARVGADYYVTTLREAVKACLQAARGELSETSEDSVPDKAAVPAAAE